MPPSAADFAAEAVQSQQIRRDCMVLEVAIQNPLKRKRLMNLMNPSIFALGESWIVRIWKTQPRPARETNIGKK